MKDKTKILSTVSIYHAFNDGVVVVIPLLFPVFKILFDLSYTQIGIITSGGLLVTLVTQLLIGRISDRKNRIFLLTLGILLMSASVLLLTCVQGFITLMLFIFLIRFSAGFYHPTGIGWISRIFKGKRVDWAMGVQSAAGDFGAFIALLSTLFIVENMNWSFPLYLWAIGGTICLFIGVFLTTNINLDFLKISNNNKKQTIAKSLRKELSYLKKIKMFIPAFIISGAAWGIIVTYLPLLLVEKTHLSLTAIGLLISVWIGIGTIICLVYNKIQKIIGRKNVVLFSYLTMALMAFCLTILTNIFVLIIIMILLGASTFLTYPALFSFVSDLIDKDIIGTTFAYTFTIQLGGGTILIFLGGFTSDIWGIWTPFFILGLISLYVTLKLLVDFKKLAKHSR